MPLLETLKSDLVAAFKTKDQVRKDVLRVVLGEVDRKSSIPTANDDEVTKIIRKLLQSNEETYKGLPDDDKRKTVLAEENRILQELVPAQASLEAVRSAILGSPIHDEVVKAKSDGQAVGVCIKFLKTRNMEVAGEDVKAVVKEIRSVRG